MSRGRCSSCHAPVIWATTRKGKAMPVDPEPVDDGNVLLVPIGTTGYEAQVVMPADNVRRGEPRYVSHFATCPKAAEHRRRR